MTKNSAGRNARSFLFGAVLVLVLAITASADSVGYAGAGQACTTLFANSSDGAAIVASTECGRTLRLFAGDAQILQEGDRDSRAGLFAILGSGWLSENGGFQPSLDFKSKDFENQRRHSDDGETRRDAVPEPGSMVLFGTGLLGAGGLLRRRKRR